MSVSAIQPSMLAQLTAIATLIQHHQLPVNQYLADSNRAALSLPVHMQAMTALINRLNNDLYGKIPFDIWQSHYNSTKTLLELLRTVEAGFS
jgi:hypothetical protein